MSDFTEINRPLENIYVPQTIWKVTIAFLLLLTPSYLEVSGSLKGLVADAADVAAVFAVGLSAVAPKRVGVLELLVTVVALVLVLRP